MKTGFRHGLAGYQGICGVTPDLSVFGKAIANGYPMGVVGGKRALMEYCVHPGPRQAGSHRGHLQRTSFRGRGRERDPGQANEP